MKRVYMYLWQYTYTLDVQVRMWQHMCLEKNCVFPWWKAIISIGVLVWISLGKWLEKLEHAQIHRARRIPGLSDQRPCLIVAHGLLFGSFLPNRSPWASIWRKHCYDVLERNCQIKAHGLVFRNPWYWRYFVKWSIKNYCWQDNCNSSC